MNPLPIILAGLRRGKMQHAALVLLIAAAVAIGFAVTTGERSMRKGTARAAEAFDLLIAAPGSPTQLVMTVIYLRAAPLDMIPGQTLNRLAADPGVVYAAPVGFGDFYRGHPLIGTTIRQVTRGETAALTAGRNFSRYDEAVIGSRVALALGDQFHPGHGHHRDPEDAGDHGPEHRELDLKIVGRMAPTGTPWDDAVLLPIETVWWLHAMPTGHQGADPALWPIGTYDAEPGPLPAIIVKPRSVADAYRLRGDRKSVV